jgi:phosphodiesterase/alkaline phosphatase D-like protein
VKASYTAPPGTLVISAVNASGITVSGATITWTTNEAATSRVEYGLTEEWGSSTTLETLVTSHSVELAGLKADTTYHYRVISKDAANNEAVSLDQTFTTAGSSGGMPAWVWAIFVVMGMGVVGGACAAYFIGARMAKKK